ncbi:MAG: radical SAM protein [Candidatus Margulisbacteria bacterium]|jgi:tRNA-2-methylthio-N6-dimethylallyladenosine synthase|nr:radical SAM protein [Candidatus Margulisiibacteriota bacterium]
MAQTYHIITFGCQMNKNDSEHLAGMLEFNGAKHTAEPEAADILVLNTCAVRDKAERRVYGQLAKYNFLRQKNNSGQKLFLSGCMPAYNKTELQKAAPFLDGFLDIEEARQYPPRRENSPEVWVTIMQGCNNFCAYCIVPRARGRERSRTAEDILAEINKIDFTGRAVLFLLGQNVNSYAGTFNGQPLSFPALLQLILTKCPAVPKLAFLTSHPKDMTDALLEVIAREPRIDRELHLPAQSGSDRILALMNRGYTAAQYRALTARIRARAPDVQLSTDIIAGFPTETEAEFEDSCRLVRETGFFRVNTAGYSARRGTAAAQMPRLEQKIVDARLNKINQLINSLKSAHT